MADIEKREKRGKMWRGVVVVYNVIGVAVIVTLMVWSLFEKDELIKEANLTPNNAIEIDDEMIYLYGLAALTLLVSLVIFILIDRRYKIHIKKSPVFLCFVVAGMLMAISLLQYYSGIA